MMIKLFLFLLLTTTASSDVVLNENIMYLSQTAANLSALAYQENPPPEGYEPFGFYDQEPDQAIMAKTKDGYCFGAFRGTTLTWSDWKQNVHMGKQEVCFLEECCSTRQGFYDAYMTEYRSDFETSLRNCAKTCTNKDECVVLTGHSQGGAIAAVAAIFLADLNPYVITFGQPNTIDAPCDLVTSERWYRYVNTKSSNKVGITYDPISFIPGMGADAFGHLLLLSAGGMYNVGLDAQDYFGPLNVAGFEAHSMEGTAKHPGYLDRMAALVSDNATAYPIPTSGYRDGSLCSEHEECESQRCNADKLLSFNRCVGVECKHDKDCIDTTGRCGSGRCVPKLGSCQGCNEDSDCGSNECILFKCAGSSGFMDDNCICRIDSDCQSGRCEGLTSPQCEARLGLGAYCNQDSDCISEYCTWRFHCERKKVDGTFCTQNTECESGRCSWRFACASLMRTLDLTDVPQEGSSMQEEKQNEASSTSENDHTGSAAGVVTCGVIVLIAAVVYFGRKKIFNWRNGYQEVPSITLNV